MSFLKNLFGGAAATGKAAGENAVGGEESYKGYVIKALLMQVGGGEYQLAGLIEKELGGETQSYKFVRADRMSSRDDVVALALAKGRQIVDEQGDGVFSQTWPKPN